MVGVATRVLDGGSPFFRDIAPWIDAAVEPGDVPILTLGAADVRPRPRRYWFYNTEDLHHARKRTASYLEALDGAERVFDYAEPNLAVYPRAEFRPIRLGTVEPRRDVAGCDIDVLFFGLVTPRRAPILSAVGATVMSRLHGEALRQAVCRARVVLCVHAYDDVTNDAFRVFRALTYGGSLVVERSRESWFNEAVAPYAPVVSYAELVKTCQGVIASSC